MRIWWMQYQFPIQAFDLSLNNLGNMWPGVLMVKIYFWTRWALLFKFCRQSLKLCTVSAYCPPNTSHPLFGCINLLSESDLAFDADEANGICAQR